MAHQPATSVKPSRVKLALVLFGVVGAVVGAASAGAWMYLRDSGHNMTGLEGTWRDPANSRHTYEFRSNGDVDAWVGSKSWWNRMGWSATWRPDGQQITVHTDRNWDFKGELNGNTIRGKMLLKNQSGAVESEIDTVWQRE